MGFESRAQSGALNINDVALTHSANSFVVLDATLYKNKPNLSLSGIKPANVFYVARFWDDWSKAPKDKLPDEKLVRKLAREARAKNSLLIVDIEHWPLSGDDKTIADSISKYSTVMQWIRNEEPELKTGYFGILPVANYSIYRKTVDSSDYKQWQIQNDRLKPLARVVDVIFPYTYTYYPDQEAWVQFAIKNIKEARRYGKPVYVFLWPQYTEQNKKLSGQYVAPDYWKLQLETVRQYADGVVIWGGWGDNGPVSWDENAPWWQVTKEFLDKLKRED